MDVKLVNSTNYVSRAQLPFASQSQLQQAKFTTGNDTFEKADGKMSTTKKVLIGGAILAGLALLATAFKKPQSIVQKVDDISADFINAVQKEIETRGLKGKIDLVDITHDAIKNSDYVKLMKEKGITSRYVVNVLFDKNGEELIRCAASNNASFLKGNDLAKIIETEGKVRIF